MRKQKTFFSKLLAGQLLLLSLSALGLYTQAGAQSTLNADGQVHTLAYTGSYVDYTIPDGSTYPYLYLKATGADGGDGTDQDNGEGGVGATAAGYIKIGAGVGEVPPGATLRVIIGQQGKSRGNFGGGGGGTGIAFKKKGADEWELLLVAGGGGGAGGSYDGREGVIFTGGSNGIGQNGIKMHNAGANGYGGGNGPDASGGGGYRGDGDGVTEADGLAQTGGGRGNNSAGEPVGGPGGSGSIDQVFIGSADYDYADGGFGYGGGGAGARVGAFIFSHGYIGGGGGGYSGGGGGNYNGGGGGGGSYVNEAWIKQGFKVDGDATSNPQDGYIRYQFTNDYSKETIRLSKNSEKCLDAKDGGTSSGTNVQLYDCNGKAQQNWVFDGLMIKNAKDQSQCLEIQGSNPYNGANVELWGCNNGTNAQKWVYDGVKRLIRSARNLDKCMDLVNGQTSNGNNIQIWDCKSIGAQQWLVGEAVTSPTSASLQSIHSLYSTGKCMDLQGGGNGGTANGTNVQLWTCYDGNARQQWYFNGAQIKFNADQNKCLDLLGANTANGSNIALWDCNGAVNQQWIYDGVTQTIRSGKDLNKCIHIKDSSKTNGANLEIWTCNESSTSQFEIN